MRHFGNIDAGGMKRDLLEREMNRMLSGSESRLSDDATHMLDRYATGGLQIIIDEIKNQTELFIFMKKYHKLVQKYCDK